MALGCTLTARGWRAHCVIPPQSGWAPLATTEAVLAAQWVKETAARSGFMSPNNTFQTRAAQTAKLMSELV